LGAKIFFDESSHILEIDTTQINSFELGPELMGKMRASIFVMGPLLARFGKVKVVLPGGCLIGSRPINFHVKGSFSTEESKKVTKQLPSRFQSFAVPSQEVVTI